jgi:hypothetical protein
MADLPGRVTPGAGAANGQRLAEREQGTDEPYAMVMRRARAGAAELA